MAKALFGHVGIGSDPRLLAEVTRLRARVRDLEHEVAVLRATSEALASSISVEDDLRSLTLEPSEPALT